MIDDAVFGVLKAQVDRGAVRKCRALVDRLRGRLFAQQLAFVDDPDRHKALLCPRRAGKTYALAVYMYITCLLRPYANVVFIARTRDKAREIIWELLKKLDSDFEIGARFSEVHSAGLLPNGSRFRLRGCETRADIDQFRGEPFHLVILDEAASHAKHVLDPLIDQALEATLGDYRGTMVLAGTPGPVLDGRFYEVTGDLAFEIKAGDEARSRPYGERSAPKWAGVEYGWSYHSWTRRDNVILPHLWEEALRIKKLNGWSDQNPIWLREYIGRWIASDSTLVYKYNPERNVWAPGKQSEDNPFGLPEGHVWHYVMGIDFGTVDPFAIVITAYADTHPHLFMVYEFQQRGMQIPDMANKILSLAEIAPIERMVGDYGPYGELLETNLAQEYGLVVRRAQKKEKRDHIELLNGDFIDGRAFLKQNSETARQMLVLSWDDTGLKERTGGSIRNDCCDALVYTWREVQHHFASAPISEIDPNSPEAERLRAQDEERAMIERETRMIDPDQGDASWIEGDTDQW